MATVIGLDIGTTTICGVAVTSSGELLASVERPNDSAVVGLPAGRAEQDPRRIRARAFEVLGELARRVDTIGCVGLTGQMHGMLCVDAKGEPRSNLITWQDARCLEHDRNGRSVLTRMRESVPPALWTDCGCEPASGFLGSTLCWLTANHALPADTLRVSFVHDWLGAVLTGGLPVTDPADAGSAGLFDLSRMQWHEGVIASLGLPGAMLPPVRESGEVIGSLTRSIAAECGLPPGTPVCNATGDNQASLIGSVADIDKSVLVNIGTGGQISWAIPSFHRAAGMETRYLPCRRFMLVGASLCGGRAYAWLNDVVRDWLHAMGFEIDRDSVYAKLNELAASAQAGADGLVARTTLGGTRKDPAVRGAIEGISLQNFSLPNVARAVLEGLVEELGAYYDAVSDACSRHETVVASGNAVRKNPLLREIIARRLGRPVKVPRHREEAAFGAALVGGVGAGIWRDMAEAGRCVRYA